MICMVKGRNQFEVIVLFAYPTENILRTADRSAKISKNTTRYFYKYFNMTDFKWVSQIFLCQLLPLSQPLGKSFSPSQRTVAFPICKLKFKSKKSKTLFFQEQSDLIIIIKKTLKVNVYRKCWVSKMTCVVRSMQSGLNTQALCISPVYMAGDL